MTAASAEARSLRTDAEVMFVIDGIPFKGHVLEEYNYDGRKMAAVAVDGYAVCGNWITAEADDSAVQVSVDSLV